MDQEKNGKFPLRPGELLTTEMLLESLGISKNTLAAWRKQKLPFVDRSKLGTKSDYYWTDDVLSFIRSHGTDNAA